MAYHVCCTLPLNILLWVSLMTLQHWVIWRLHYARELDTLLPEPNDCPFADDISKCNLLNEWNSWHFDFHFATLSLWGMKKTTLPKLVEFTFLSPICLVVLFNAEVLIVVVVVGYVQGSWSQVSTFSCYSHCLPLTRNASEGYENNFQEPVL